MKKVILFIMLILTISIVSANDFADKGGGCKTQTEAFMNADLSIDTQSINIIADFDFNPIFKIDNIIFKDEEIVDKTLFSFSFIYNNLSNNYKQNKKYLTLKRYENKEFVIIKPLRIN